MRRLTEDPSGWRASFTPDSLPPSRFSRFCPQTAAPRPQPVPRTLKAALVAPCPSTAAAPEIRPEPGSEGVGGYGVGGWTPRAVARILHGLGSPAFPASEWSKQPMW